MSNMNYNFLYAFTNEGAALVEIKRTDLPPGAPVGSVYHWLLIQGTRVTKLTFLSMERGEVEKREFAEGKLEFTSNEAKFNNSVFRKFEPTENLKAVISNFIFSLDKA